MATKHKEIRNKLPVVITVKLTGDADIKKLNSKFRKKDYATDVLSFNLDEQNDNGDYILGDVIVNVDQAERQAGEYSNSIEEEIAELAGHGILHLLGIHHPEDE